jgi:hypothetical protein
MTTSGSGSPSAHPVPAPSSPFDILADELGAVAGQIEREINLRVTAAIAEFARKDLERELLLTKLVQDTNDRINARLATVRDGIDGKDGAPGRDGADGLPGNDGKDGLDGKDGRDGAAGEKGEKGETGSAGLPGERGADGRDGSPGEKGDAGPQGEKGLTGERGLEGPPGKLPIVKAWSEGVHYEGEIRSHLGATYQAAYDTGKEPGTSDDWICIAARGTDGTDGRGFKIRGTYSADKKFEWNDIVACNGGSFVALKDDPGDCPGPDWQLIAGPGKRGDKGQPGDKGLPGKEGVAGTVIAGWIVNAKSYSAVPVMSDGSHGPEIEMRALFEQFEIETR